MSSPSGLMTVQAESALSVNGCSRCLCQGLEHIVHYTMWSASRLSVFTNIYALRHLSPRVCVHTSSSCFSKLHVVPIATSTVPSVIGVAAHQCAVPNQPIPLRGNVKVGAAKNFPPHQCLFRSTHEDHLQGKANAVALVELLSAFSNFRTYPFAPVSCDSQTHPPHRLITRFRRLEKQLFSNHGAATRIFNDATVQEHPELSVKMQAFMFLALGKLCEHSQTVSHKMPLHHTQKFVLMQSFT